MCQEHNQDRGAALELLSGLVRAVSAAEDETSAASSVVETFRDASGYELAAVFFGTRSGDLVLRAMAGDFPDSVPPGYRIPPSEGLVGRAFAEGRLQEAADVLDDPRYLAVDGHEIRSEIAVPIRLEGRAIGVVDIQSRRPMAFSPRDREIVSAVADLIGVVVGRVRLVERLERRRRDAEDALVLARSVEQTKDRFLSAVSHEFRTPLTSIRSFAEILLTHDAEDAETTREFISIIHEESIRLSRLVNNLLDLSKMQAGRMEWDFQMNEISEAVRRATRSVSSVAGEKEVEIEVESPRPVPPFVFDRDKVIQVLVNLLSNAVKYSPRGGRVTLSTEPFEGGARVAVLDRGPGIPPEDRELIFDRFRQAGAPGERKPGTGLGLSISLEILNAHGGRIWAEEAPGGGSRFVFELPAKPSAPEAPPRDFPDEEDLARPVPAAAGNHRRILVVDGERNARQYLEYELSRAGYRVHGCPDGMDALRRARDDPPDLIILDLFLPALSGRDVLLLLDGDPTTSPVPVIALSDAPEEDSEGLPGVVRVLRKPADGAHLLTAVHEVLEPEKTSPAGRPSG